MDQVMALVRDPGEGVDPSRQSHNHFITEVLATTYLVLSIHLGLVR